MIYLDAQSARRIIDSKDNIEVLYNGSPVWIQDVNSNTAKVRFLDSDKVQEVAVGELVEAGIVTI
jgi:small acid-soluble spore protein H (minor)